MPHDLKRHLAFEQLLTDLSSRFVYSQVATLDAELFSPIESMV